MKFCLPESNFVCLLNPFLFKVSFKAGDTVELLESIEGEEW